ncbi:zinc-ribbon domain containing protein, partial [Patescibacteria group bacterium]|nr:zinc-ribbon domain containing protein [Patescibacteria group bacterium]
MICDNCQQKFNISKQDQEYYKSFNVPEPTWCPDCRKMRRLSMRNERTFYQRRCDFCNKDIIAYYPKKSHQVVYCPECWYSDSWDPNNFSKDFNFEKPFFEQFKALYKIVPTLSLDVVNCENSQYVSYCGDDKSCYYDIAGEANEQCFYGKFVKYSKDCVDNSFVYNSELCYECVNCHNCYGSTWLTLCYDCDHCHNCYDL